MTSTLEGTRALFRHGSAALVFLCLATTAAAQAVTPSALKAAFLYNFAKFAEWPADSVPATGSLTLCVVGDSSVADALEDTVKGRNVDSHPLVVVQLKANEPPRACHLLYVSGLEGKQSSHLVESLKGLAILTVSDLEQFAQSGGVAQFFVENGRMRFAINVDAAQRARLHLSSRLLTLARVVKENRGEP